MGVGLARGCSELSPPPVLASKEDARSEGGEVDNCLEVQQLPLASATSAA